MVRSLTRRRAGSIGIAMALALSITASTGAEEGSLCEALTLEDVSAIVDLPWELYFEDATACSYGEPEGHPFSHRVTVQWDEAGYTFAELMAMEESYEVMAGEHRGVSLTFGALFVQVGDQLLFFHGNFSDPDVQSRVDIDGFVLDVARATVGDLPEGGSFDPGAADRAAEAEAAAAGLPQVDAIKWHVYRDLHGAEVMDDSDDAQRAFWQAVLETPGAEGDGMSEMQAGARSALSGEELGQYTRVVVPGADGAALKAAFEEQFGALLGPDLVVEDVVVGGKDVSALLIADQPQAYVYFVGDALHLILGPEDIAELIIAELP